MSAEHGSISGRVVNAAGAPVVGASVAISGSSQPHRDIAAITASDGRFHFGRMQPGAYRVAARAQQSRRSTDVVVPANAEVDVEIRLDD